MNDTTKPSEYLGYWGEKYKTSNPQLSPSTSFLRVHVLSY